MKSILLTLLLINTSLLSRSQESITIVRIENAGGYGNNFEFAKKAAALLEEIINSNDFKSRMLNTTYLKTKGYSNLELYNMIKQAIEVQGFGGEARVIDLKVRTIRIDGDEKRWKNNCRIGSRSGTIGIDGNGDGVMAICPERLELWANQNNIASLAGHYAHEYMHLLGFDHYKRFSNHSWRSKTFVYKIGNLIEEMARERQNTH